MAKLTRMYVGIDYHVEFCAVCIMDASGEVIGRQNCDSSVEYLVKYDRWACDQEVEVIAAIEVCGGAAQLADKLRQRGWQVSLTRVGYLPRVWLAPERLRQLRSLVRHRQQLAHRKRQEKLRIRALMHEAGRRLSGRAWTVTWLSDLQKHQAKLGDLRAWICQQHLDELRHLEGKIQEVEKIIAQQLVGDATAQALLAQPGVGFVTATTLLAETGNFARFARGKQLARFCGTAPVNHSSGGKGGDLGLGRQCNRELRRVIVETADRLARHVPRWRQLKDRLRANGKSGAEATAAVANRWLRWLHYEMTQGTRQVPTENPQAA